MNLNRKSHGIDNHLLQKQLKCQMPQLNVKLPVDALHLKLFIYFIVKVNLKIIICKGTTKG